MFRLCTGWLGWTPAVVLATPVPQLELALEGRVDFILKTSPFGSPGSKTGAGNGAGNGGRTGAKTGGDPAAVPRRTLDLSSATVSEAAAFIRRFSKPA